MTFRRAGFEGEEKVLKMMAGSTYVRILPIISRLLSMMSTDKSADRIVLFTTTIGEPLVLASGEWNDDGNDQDSTKLYILKLSRTLSGFVNRVLVGAILLSGIFHFKAGQPSYPISTTSKLPTREGETYHDRLHVGRCLFFMLVRMSEQRIAF